MLARLYLRASTKEQDAARARDALEAFAVDIFWPHRERLNPRIGFELRKRYQFSNAGISSQAPMAAVGDFVTCGQIVWADKYGDKF